MNKENQSKTNENSNIIPVTTNDVEERMIVLRQQPVLIIHINFQMAISSN